jgi:hypothetical protein
LLFAQKELTNKEQVIMGRIMGRMTQTLVASSFDTWVEMLAAKGRRDEAQRMAQGKRYKGFRGCT